MAKLITTPIGSFTQAAVTTINANMDAIEAAIENTLSRDGTIPNQMTADIDLNNNDILNVNTLDVDSITLDGELLIPADINAGTAAALLTAIKTVDGAGSGLDADLLDGLNSTAFVLRDFVLNVKDFGAVGNGIADDTTAIQAAIDYLNAAGGGRLFFPRGTYLTTNAISMKSKIWIYGEGEASLIKSISLTDGGVGYGHRQIDCRAISHFAITDLSFDASGMTVFTSGMRTILCTDAASNFIIANNNFTTPGAATACIGVSEYRIINNDITVNSFDTIAKHDGVIDQWGGSNKFLIQGNVVRASEQGHYGILVTGETTAGVPAECFDFSICYNRVYNAQDVGIWTNGREGINRDFNISFNLIDSVRDFHGIIISDTIRGSVEGNDIKNIAGNGIRLDKESTSGGITSALQIVVKNNIVLNANVSASTSNQEGAAIAIANESSDCIISGNVVKGTTHTNAIFLASTSLSNRVFGNKLDGGTRNTVNNQNTTNLIERERLTAARTYFVRTDGNDTFNDGLGNTSLRAFLTIQKAVDAANSIDAAGFDVTISVGDGTRTVGATIDRPLTGGGILTIQGNTATPANCVINTTSSNCFSVRSNSKVIIRGFKLTTTTSGSCLLVDLGAYLTYGNIDFGACANMHIDVGSEAIAFAAFDYSITGSAVGHFHTGAPATLVTNPITITLTGTPAFSAYFSGTAGGYQVLSNIAFSGSATGKRYLAHKNGTIDVGTTSETFLPGNVAGTTESGGKYAGDTTFRDLIGDAGTFTPTLTAVANVSASTSRLANWTRIKTGTIDRIRVTGRVEVTPTAAASTATQLGISLPVASALTDATTEMSGQAATSFGIIGAISADTANDRAQLQFPATNTSSNVFYYTFEYTVV